MRCGGGAKEEQPAGGGGGKGYLLFVLRQEGGCWKAKDVRCPLEFRGAASNQELQHEQGCRCVSDFAAPRASSPGPGRPCRPALATPRRQTLDTRHQAFNSPQPNCFFLCTSEIIHLDPHPSHNPTSAASPSLLSAVASLLVSPGLFLPAPQTRSILLQEIYLWLRLIAPGPRCLPWLDSSY